MALNNLWLLENVASARIEIKTYEKLFLLLFSYIHLFRFLQFFFGKSFLKCRLIIFKSSGKQTITMCMAKKNNKSINNKVESATYSETMLYQLYRI